MLFLRLWVFSGIYEVREDIYMCILEIFLVIKVRDWQLGYRWEVLIVVLLRNDEGLN